MNRAIVTVILLTACDATRSSDATLRVCLLSGSAQYKSDVSLRKLQEELESHYGCECAWVQGRDRGKELKGIEALDECDVMVVFVRRMEPPNAQLDRVRKYCDAGRSVVGIRTASHAFQKWPEFDKLVLGGNYRGHYGKGLCKVTIAPEAKAHPILAGVQSFESQGSLYKNQGLAAKDILLWGEVGGQREPVAWTHAYKGGRVFYTSLGHPADFADPAFLRLLTNALRWVTAATSP